MSGAFGLFLVSVCLVGQTSASPTVTHKHRHHSKVDPKEASTTIPPTVSDTLILKNQNNSIPRPKSVPVKNLQPQSSASVYARLRNRILSYVISKKAERGDQTTTSTTVILENLTNASTTSAPGDNQSSTSSTVALKDDSDVTTTEAPDEDLQQSTEGPFVTFKYEDYHAHGALKAPHNDSQFSVAAAAIRDDPHLLQLFQQIMDLELDMQLPAYMEGHLVNSSHYTFNPASTW